MPKTVAMMQPTYLPWLGYFDIMDQVEEFIVLDTVQFERHSWQHRNRVKGPNGEILLSIPVKRTGLLTTIQEAELADLDFAKKHLKSIEGAYARATALPEHRQALQDLYRAPARSLVDFLLSIIEWLRGILRIQTPMVRASSLLATGSKDALVRALCETRGASRYLATAGSRDYMTAGTAFKDAPLEVVYHSYVCVPYGQLHGAFVPQLSALDAVLNLGTGARDTMLAGRHPPIP